MRQFGIRSLVLGAIVALPLAFASCASARGEGFIKPGLDVSTITRIAIVDGNNPSYKPETRQALIDTFQLEFFKRGWNVIERANVQKAVDEMNFQHSDLASDADRKALGHVLNVSALTIINLASVGDDISMTAKMMDVETGELLWMGSGDGSVNAKTSAITGALLGVAVGAAVGHNMNGNAGVGAAAGAIGGGLAGSALAPSQLENAKAVIVKVCDTLPKRM